MATPNYDINYDDERLTSVKSEESLALKQDLKHYDDAIGNINENIKDQQTAINQYKDEQTKIQNESLQNTLAKIEQDKSEAKQDYLKEQSGAYVDWQKQSDEYGATSEKIASAGLAGSGYSESSQVSMYNTYQNRVAAARVSYERTIADYNIAIADAKTKNSSVLAEIAYNAMVKGLELSLNGIVQTTELLTQKANQKLAIKQMYHNKYMDILDQINKENALREQVRMNEASIAHQKAQEEIARAQLAEEKRQFDILHPATTGGGSVGGGKIKGNGKSYRTSTGNSSGRGGTQINRVSVDQKTTNGQKDPEVANRHGDSWVEIPGHGRFSWTEVAAYVASGQVKETVVNGKLKYTWVKKEAKNVTPDVKGYAAKMKELFK